MVGFPKSGHIYFSHDNIHQNKNQPPKLLKLVGCNLKLLHDSATYWYGLKYGRF